MHHRAGVKCLCRKLSSYSIIIRRNQYSDHAIVSIPTLSMGNYIYLIVPAKEALFEVTLNAIARSTR